MTITDFWDLLELIREVVDDQVRACDTQLWGIPVTVQRKLARQGYKPVEVIEDILGFVESLQTIRVVQRGEPAGEGAAAGASPPAATPVACVDKLRQWFSFARPAPAAALNDPADLAALLRVPYYRLEQKKRNALGAEELERRRDEVLMEYLTAAWLALYFLGMPFIHPWQQVRRMADTRGGFPSGGCIAKFAGDVYRQARRTLERDMAAPDMGPCSMLVFSHVPYVLLPGLIDCPDDDDITPPSVHALGRLYATLQMRLYFDRGYPAEFFIPVDGLMGALGRLANVGKPGRGQRSLEEIIKDIEPWLRTLFANGNGNQRVTLLSRDSPTAGLPSCILGPRVGIYSLEAGSSGLHFSGNQVREALLASYRTKLTKLATPNRLELLPVPLGETLDDEILRFLRRHNRGAGSLGDQLA